MPKICHVTSVHSSDDTRVFHKECVSLSKAGYDTWLVAPGESREESGVHIVGIGPKPQGTARRLLSGIGRKAYETALSLDCEVYHIHDPELLPFAKKLARKGKKVIFDSHEFYARLIYERGYFPAPLRKPLSRLYERCETGVLKHMEAVVVPCTLDGRNVFEGRVPRTVYVDNLPGTERFPETHPLRPEAENTVGYVGSITRARGAESMIRACHAAGARLRLAGGTWPAYQQTLEAMPEYACVEYEGVLPYSQVPDFCQRIQAGLCLLQNVGQYASLDNLPTKVYEYLGSGRPVILSDTRPAKKLREQYSCCLCVNPDDEREIARAIRYLLDDPEEAQAMGERGYRAVMEKYNWANEEKKLLALYRELTE